MNALPTRRDEAWRWSDVEALASAWPLPPVRGVVVAPGETFTHAIVQDAADEAVAVEEWRIVLGAGARAALHVVNTGGRLGRVAVTVEVGEGADFALRAAIVGGGRQTLEIVTDVQHLHPGGTSSQVVRSVLAGRATGNYIGRVAVARNAQKVDGSQSVKAMLLDRTATANAKPELEIFADDVKCAHGATVGELDARALFYLQSRGVPPAEAKVLLLRAFVADAFGDVEGDARELLEQAARRALERLL